MAFHEDEDLHWSSDEEDNHQHITTSHSTATTTSTTTSTGTVPAWDIAQVELFSPQHKALLEDIRATCEAYHPPGQLFSTHTQELLQDIAQSVAEYEAQKKTSNKPQHTTQPASVAPSTSFDLEFFTQQLKEIEAMHIRAKESHSSPAVQEPEEKRSATMNSDPYQKMRELAEENSRLARQNELLDEELKKLEQELSSSSDEEECIQEKNESPKITSEHSTFITEQTTTVVTTHAIKSPSPTKHTSSTSAASSSILLDSPSGNATTTTTMPRKEQRVVVPSLNLVQKKTTYTTTEAHQQEELELLASLDVDISLPSTPSSTPRHHTPQRFTRTQKELLEYSKKLERISVGSSPKTVKKQKAKSTSNTPRSISSPRHSPLDPAIGSHLEQRLAAASQLMQDLINTSLYGISPKHCHHLQHHHQRVPGSPRFHP